MITVLDGGMGGEIQRRVPEAAHGLWSASALINSPEMVTEIHREYIAAGATVITTNTYSTIPSYLGKGGLEHRYVELTETAARLARQAAPEGDGVLVAGSLPPLSESYRADLVPSPADATPVYRNMVRAMVDHVDLFLCETMASAEEAHTAASAALALGGGKPVFVSWTLHEKPGSGLRSRESVTEAYGRLDGLAIDAFLFNCTHPEAIEVALTELGTLTDKPVGCYPNRLNAVPEGWTLDNEVVTGARRDLPRRRMWRPSCAALMRARRLLAGVAGLGRGTFGLCGSDWTGRRRSN